MGVELVGLEQCVGAGAVGGYDTAIFDASYEHYDWEWEWEWQCGCSITSRCSGTFEMVVHACS